MRFRDDTCWYVAFALLTSTGCNKRSNDASVGSSPQAQLVLPAIDSGTIRGIRFTIVSGEASFLIDAPLEKIKGSSSDVVGELDIATDDLARTRGEVRVRVSTLKTMTFDDPKKNETQTRHARNWMEVGTDSLVDAKTQFEYARFSITSVEVPIATLADVAEDATKTRSVKIKATGDLTLHGVSVLKTTLLLVGFHGPPTAPGKVTVKTEQPFNVSLREHDIKPRDTFGKFLSGAFEKVGKKIDDNVQISVTFTANSG